MRAAIYPGGGGPITIETVDDPEPGADDLIIRVHRCGICGTDLHMTEGHSFQFPAGSTPGHEFAGEVVAMGRNVTGWNAGDRLTALPSTGCGQCVSCEHGNWTLCSNAPGQMGGFAEYARILAATAVRLPGTLSLADGALIEPLAVGRYGVRQAAITAESRVLVLGGGSVALCAIWWARVMGAGRIVALSRSPRRAELALAMGADAYVEAGEDEALRVREALGGEADLVLECIGQPGMLGRGIQHVRKFGEVISMGFCTAPDGMIPAMAAFKAATLKFPVGYALADFEESARLFDRGHANPAMMITGTASLEQLPAAFAELRGANDQTKMQVII